MRIAFFIDSIGFGGAEKSLLALLKNLDYTRLQVDLYTQEKDIPPEIGSMIPKEVNHHQIPYTKHHWLMRKCKLDYSLRIRLLPRLGIKRHLSQTYWQTMRQTYPTLKEEYDVAIAYMQGFSTYYVADKVKAKKKLAWINSQLNAHKHDVKFNRQYYSKYDHVVAVSDILNQILVDNGYVASSKISVIYDIIDADDVKRHALEPCPIDCSHDTTIVTVARLSPEKNLQLAIESAKILRDRGYDFIWYIIGRGISKYDLKRRISESRLDDRVKLLGAISNPYTYMKAADIYVLTSLAEGFGMTIAEAKIVGTPVVSTNFPLVHIQITDGENGLIAEMTPESVASKIMRLIEDKPLRAAIKENLAKEKNLTKHTEKQKFLKLLYD